MPPPPPITAVIPWGPRHGPPAALAAVLAACPLVADVVLVADGHPGHSAPTGEKLRLLTTGPRPRGPAHTRNLGAARADTPLLLFVDADVGLPPRWMSAAVGLLASHPAGHVCGVVGVYAPGAGVGRLAVYKNAWLRYSYARAPLTQGGLLSSALLLRREDFLAVGGFDESFTRPGVEDTALGRALLGQGRVAAVLPTPGLGHDKSLTPWGFLRLTFARAKGLAALPPPVRTAVAPIPPSLPNPPPAGEGAEENSPPILPPGHSLPPFLWPVMATTLFCWGLAAVVATLWPGRWPLAVLPLLLGAGATAGLAKDFFVALKEDFGPAAPAWGAAIMMLEMPVAMLGGVTGWCSRRMGGGSRRA